jgi:ribosomal protein S28E/S33
VQMGLVGGPPGPTSQGRLEVLHAGVWGTVCDDAFNDATGEFICRTMLGLPLVVADIIMLNFSLREEYYFPGHTQVSPTRG